MSQDEYIHIHYTNAEGTNWELYRQRISREEVIVTKKFGLAYRIITVSHTVNPVLYNQITNLINKQNSVTWFNQSKVTVRSRRDILDVIDDKDAMLKWSIQSSTTLTEDGRFLSYQIRRRLVVEHYSSHSTM